MKKLLILLAILCSLNQSVLSDDSTGSRNEKLTTEYIDYKTNQFTKKYSLPTQSVKSAWDNVLEAFYLSSTGFFSTGAALQRITSGNWPDREIIRCLGISSLMLGTFFAGCAFLICSGIPKHKTYVRSLDAKLSNLEQIVQLGSMLTKKELKTTAKDLCEYVATLKRIKIHCDTSDEMIIKIKSLKKRAKALRNAVIAKMINKSFESQI